MLYTFRHSPFNCNIQTLLQYMQPGDCLLLIEDGVLAGLLGSAALAVILGTSCSVYALLEDINARGLSDHFSPKISCIDYTGFVKLTVEHQQHFAW